MWIRDGQGQYEQQVGHGELTNNSLLKNKDIYIFEQQIY
ncbi:hypothetical protein J2S19_002989 [Metabacillus malikii]|uniref:Uncharacterized protein n=1 Tax=Metabacillus malikii TaxID=1504265 RepID=A0ABT9ZIA1_9BACI|nr:hypothetical protein [Metabacillus malikii]